MKFYLILALIFTVSTLTMANDFKKGEHYDVLDLEASEKPIVTEFFSFYSPHANTFEPIIQLLKKKLPKEAKFQRTHVSTIGGDMAQVMSKAYALMVALKVEDKMVKVMFDYIHKLRKTIKSEQQIRQIFIDNGVDAKKFDMASKSFAVDSMLRKFDKSFEKTKLKGVPAIVVNNKYLVTANGLKSMDQYFELVNYLLTKVKQTDAK